MTRHDPRCAIFHDPPSMRDPRACDCGLFDTPDPVPPQASTRAVQYAAVLRERVSRFDETCEPVELTRGEALDLARLLEVTT